MLLAFFQSVPSGKVTGTALSAAGSLLLTIAAAKP
jgi:hypothetical protein